MFRVDPKNGNVHLVRKGSPLDEMYGIDFDSNGTMCLAATRTRTATLTFGR